MFRCRIANALYALIPAKRWRGLLVRIHLDNCPGCRAALADKALVRSLLVQPAEVSPGRALWPGIEQSLKGKPGRAEKKREAVRESRRWRWAAAAAGAVLVILAGTWAWKGLHPTGGSVASLPPARFELEYVRVGGQPADAYMYQPQGSDIIIVWAGKPN
jgi:predicted anti-sigma-YlaC factor YlaD